MRRIGSREHFVVDDDMQRKELQRLLGTAKGEDRKGLIRNAIAALGTGNDTLTSTEESASSLSPLPAYNSNTSIDGSSLSLNYLHPHLNNIIPVEVVSTGGALKRPSSALRRPSITSLSTLTAIPENRAIVHETLDIISECDLVIDDIADISSSSYDCRFSPKSLFKKQSKSKSRATTNIVASPSAACIPGWICTGMLPQLLNICFNITWKMRRIEVTCFGVQEIKYTITSTRAFASDVQSNIFEKKSNTLFVCDLSTIPSSTTGPIGAVGNRLIISFSKATDDFFLVTSIKVNATSVGSMF